MNSTLFTPEELSEIKELLTKANEALIHNVYAKAKIKEALKKLTTNEKTIKPNKNRF